MISDSITMARSVFLLARRLCGIFAQIMFLKWWQWGIEVGVHGFGACWKYVLTYM